MFDMSHTNVRPETYIARVIRKEMAWLLSMLCLIPGQFHFWAKIYSQLLAYVQHEKGTIYLRDLVPNVSSMACPHRCKRVLRITQKQPTMRLNSLRRLGKGLTEVTLPSIWEREIFCSGIFSENVMKA